MSLLTCTERHVMRHADGYLTICDVQRGIGIVLPPATERGPKWGVVFLYLRMDRPECVQIPAEYGKN